MTFRFKPLVLLGFTLLTVGVAAVQAHAKIGTSEEFLRDYSEGQRSWYYVGAFEALGNAVSITNQAQGACVWNWYATAPESRKTMIENTMRKYPTHTPSAVIIALLHKDCGVFNVK
jgi:hypothetical protein